MFNTKKNTVADYNSDLRECLYQSLTGAEAWRHNTPRTTMGDVKRRWDKDHKINPSV
jgi:hypothetical protein